MAAATRPPTRRDPGMCESAAWCDSLPDVPRCRQSANASASGRPSPRGHPGRRRSPAHEPVVDRRPLDRRRHAARVPRRRRRIDGQRAVRARGRRLAVRCAASITFPVEPPLNTNIDWDIVPAGRRGCYNPGFSFNWSVLFSPSAIEVAVADARMRSR